MSWTPPRTVPWRMHKGLRAAVGGTVADLVSWGTEEEEALEATGGLTACAYVFGGMLRAAELEP